MLKIQLLMFGFMAGLIASPIASAHDLQGADFMDRMIHLLLSFHHLPVLLAVGLVVVLTIGLIFLGVGRIRVVRKPNAVVSRARLLATTAVIFLFGA